jgi:hypothetical protein
MRSDIFMTLGLMRHALLALPPLHHSLVVWFRMQWETKANFFKLPFHSAIRSFMIYTLIISKKR